MTMPVKDNHDSSTLDNIRLDNNAGDLRIFFRNLVNANKSEALRELNAKELQFSTLYFLEPEIIRLKLAPYLNRRNLESLIIAKAISGKDTRLIKHLFKIKKDELHDILEWILLTGSDEDGSDNRYDEILELTGALLVKYYKDTSILPLISDLIFKRNRKGLLIHNLVWVFFEAHEPDSLHHLAKYLRSIEQKDFLLAIKLLSFIPCLQKYNFRSGEDPYTAVNQWLLKNSKNLVPTGECLHLSANPIPFVLKKAE